jgi:hypothetical protein
MWNEYENKPHFPTCSSPSVSNSDIMYIEKGENGCWIVKAIHDSKDAGDHDT